MFDMNLCSSMLIEETHSKEVRQKAKIAGLLHQTDDDQQSGRVYRQILVALKGREAGKACLGSRPDTGSTDEASAEDLDDFPIGG